MNKEIIILLVDWLLFTPFAFLFLRRIFKYSILSTISIISMLVINLLASIAIGFGIYHSFTHFLWAIPLIVALAMLVFTYCKHQKNYSLSYILKSMWPTKNSSIRILTIIEETIEQSQPTSSINRLSIISSANLPKNSSKESLPDKPIKRTKHQPTIDQHVLPKMLPTRINA